MAIDLIAILFADTIKVVKNEQEALSIAETVCNENNIYRNDIREYAKNNFDWKNIANKYVEAIGVIIKNED